MVRTLRPTACVVLMLRSGSIGGSMWWLPTAANIKSQALCVSRVFAAAIVVEMPSSSCSASISLNMS